LVAEQRLCRALTTEIIGISLDAGFPVLHLRFSFCQFFPYADLTGPPSRNRQRANLLSAFQTHQAIKPEAGIKMIGPSVKPG